MGLIKTAIMTGGAVYAVNKISKSAVASRNNTNSNRDAWGQQVSRGPQQTDNYHGDYQDQRHYQSAEQFPRYSAADYEESKSANEGGIQHQSSERRALPPPAYYQHQQQQPEYSQATRGGNGGRQDLAGLADMAMEFVGSSRDGGKGKKMNSVVEGFLRK